MDVEPSDFSQLSPQRHHLSIENLEAFNEVIRLNRLRDSDLGGSLAFEDSVPPDQRILANEADPEEVVRLKKILEPPIDHEIQNLMHEADECTTWFGVSPGNTTFWDSGRYATIMAETLSEIDRERYPQLLVVSFIGPTGIKSTSDMPGGH
jgi:hypothetical protein